MRVLGLTGVPGTGKTTIARHLADTASIVDANELAREVGAVEGHDEDRDALVVDEAKLRDAAREALPEGPVVVEGHLAHHCDPDLVVLLRCHPDELASRLAERDWPEAKVEENVMAETLDALVPELAGLEARELDTTGHQPEDLADRIRGLFTRDPHNADDLAEPGTVDWTATLVGGENG